MENRNEILSKFYLNKLWKSQSLTKQGPKPNFLKIDTERWIDPDEIQFRSPEEMEKLRMQQLSQQERVMEERYKQILNEEGQFLTFKNWKKFEKNPKKNISNFFLKNNFQMFASNRPRQIVSWQSDAICLRIHCQCSAGTFSSLVDYCGDSWPHERPSSLMPMHQQVSDNNFTRTIFREFFSSSYFFWYRLG